MIQEISVGIVIASAGYWILRKVLRQLAGSEVAGGCQGCSGCSTPPIHGKTGPAGCPTVQGRLGVSDSGHK